MSIRSIAVLSAVLLLSMVVFSTAEGQDRRPDEEPNLFGMMRSEDGSAVVGVVSFFISDDESVTVRTDEEGKFQVTLGPGEYVWHAESRGFEPARGKVIIPRDESSERMSISMVRVDTPDTNGIIYGKVINGDGAPLPRTLLFFTPMRPAFDPTDETGPIEARSGSDGTFRTRAPFGIYHVVAEREGYHPFEMELSVSPEKEKVRVLVEMEEMERPLQDEIDLHFEYVDSDSDGMPEKIIVNVDIDMDQEPDAVMEWIDRNSDGNPESMIFDMNVPTKMIFMIMKLLGERRPMMPPMNGGDWHPDNDLECDGDDREERPPCPDRERQREGEKRRKNGENANDQFDAKKDISKEETDKEFDSSAEDTSSKDKGSSSSGDEGFPVALAAAGSMLIIITIISASAFFLRRHRA